jgi:hypothetical protein
MSRRNIVYPMLKEFIGEYVYTDSGNITRLADFAIDTWLPGFNGTLVITGNPYTGKTQAARVMKCVCRTPYFVEGISETALYKLAKTGNTLIFDGETFTAETHQKYHGLAFPKIIVSRKYIPIPGLNETIIEMHSAPEFIKMPHVVSVDTMVHMMLSMTYAFENESFKLMMARLERTLQKEA